MKRSELINHTFLIIFSIFLLFTAAANSFAVGKATSMGDMQTVVPSGPFDVARNPALLPLQEKANSTGLYYTYISHYPGCSSQKQEQYLEINSPPYHGSVDSTVKKDDPEIKGMSGHIANLTKSGNTAFGFALADNGNDQYSVTKRKRSEENSGFDGSRYYYYKKNEVVETTELNPAFILSTGTNISNTSFIGFQIIAGFSNRIEEKKSYVFGPCSSILVMPPFPPGAPEYNEKSKKEIKKVSGELGFGYLFRNNDQQLGLLIRSGEVSWTKKKLEISREYISLGTNVEASSSTKINGKYISGPSIMVGTLKKITPAFAMAFESGIKFENTFIEKDLVYKDSSNTIEEEKSVSRYKNTYLFKVGLEVNLSKTLMFTSGLGYVEAAFETSRYNRIGNSENRVVGGYETRRVFFTLGLQYIMSNNITIDLLAACTAYRDNVNIRAESRDPSAVPPVKTEHKVKQREEGIFGYAGLGVTLSL